MAYQERKKAVDRLNEDEMNKKIAHELENMIPIAGKILSNPNRAKNFGKEKFFPVRTIIMSELTATVIYKKQPSGKYVAVFFYYVFKDPPQWLWFVPRESHILGMKYFAKYKLDVEKTNYKYNFKSEKIPQEEELL